jgi:tRNA (guanine-N7-)-methyltransferase
MTLDESSSSLPNGECKKKRSSSNANVESGDVPRTMPQKKYYRSRAHCNPLSHNDGFDYPVHPSNFDWSTHFPQISPASVDFVDIGCGFGGLTVALSRLYPDKLVLGMEIRSKVCEFVRLRIEQLRRRAALGQISNEDGVEELGEEIVEPGSEAAEVKADSTRNDDTDQKSKAIVLPVSEKGYGPFQNASCMRTNCMRYLPNFFTKVKPEAFTLFSSQSSSHIPISFHNPKGQFEKMFFCFPDPHFKRTNHRRRIISDVLLTEYAHFIKPDGRLYTITDVLELHQWHLEKCEAHPLFERLDDAEVLRDDPAVQAMLVKTEEGKKVARNGGSKYYAVYRRKHDSELTTTALHQIHSAPV